jgi:anti-anti-sigma regulatory factor
MVQEASYRWIVAARGTIELDFSDIALVSSQLIAWLFHLIQAGRLSSLVVSKANRSVLKQLKQVYLDRFVTISYT